MPESTSELSWVSVSDGTLAGSGETEGDGVAVTSGVAVGSCVTSGVAVGVFVGLGVAVGVSVGLGVAVGWVYLMCSAE